MNQAGLAMTGEESSRSCVPRLSRVCPSFLSLFDDNTKVKRGFCPKKECYDPQKNTNGKPLPSFNWLIEDGALCALNFPIGMNAGLATPESESKERNNDGCRREQATQCRDRRPSWHQAGRGSAEHTVESLRQGGGIRRLVCFIRFAALHYWHSRTRQLIRIRASESGCCSKCSKKIRCEIGG
jgi:hypothetical protein